MKFVIKLVSLILSSLLVGFSGQAAANGTSDIRAFDSASAAPAGELTLLRITPEGDDVPAGRQVVLQFDRPVVPIGSMQREADEIPVDIQPALKCDWRWINTSALSCNLSDDNKLRAATRYVVTVRPEFKTDDGVSMNRGFTHRFITVRPKVKRSRFSEWRAPGWPRLRVTFNQPVTKASVKKHLRFQLAKSASTRYSIDVQAAKNDRQPIFWAPFPGEPYGLINPVYKSTQPDDRKTEVRGQEARRIWVVEPTKEMPLDSDILLRVEPGLVSAMGPEKGAESRTVVSFSTYPEFKFLGIRCSASPNADRRYVSANYSAEDVIPDDATLCLPRHTVSLEFSAPVINEEVKAHVIFKPDLAGGRSDYDPWANQYSYSRLRYPHRAGTTYSVNLPEVLKAYQRYEVRTDAVGIKDEFGRSLQQPISRAFMTSHRLPAMKINHKQAVLEKNIDSDVPVYVTNLEKLKIPHERITLNGKVSNEQYQVDLEKAQDIAYATPLGVRTMLQGQTGVVSGYLDSEPRVRRYRKEYYEFFAQVTPFQVHVKLGHFNSLVWVTDLASGAPIKSAKLELFKDNYSLNNFGTQDIVAEAKSDKQGIAWLPGLETISPDLELIRSLWRKDKQRLFIRVEHKGDMALIPLDGSYQASSNGVWPSMRKKDGHMHAWGTTAQGVYKVGDTIQYKFYVRNQSNKHWVASVKEGYSLKVFDPKGEVVQETDDLRLSGFGAYSGEVKLSKQAAVGWYRFELTLPNKSKLTPLKVLVSDFTPSPFRVRVDLNGKQFEPGDKIDINAAASLHAGGPYTNAETRITARLKQQQFTSDHAIAKNFTFEKYLYNRKEFTLHQNSGTGDDRGEISDGFELKDSSIYYGNLAVEAAVRDDRGKYIAAQTAARYYGRDRYVGLRNTKWTYDEDKPAQIEYIVVDKSRSPIAGTNVNIDIEREEVKASRVKGAGNAYLTQYTRQWVSAGRCSGISTSEAQICSFTPEHPGSYRFTAKITDSKQRTHSTQISAWVIGKGQVYWQEPDNYSLPIVPESDSYKVGDTGKYLIKNPFPGATALITIERYGVLKQWTQVFRNSTEILEVPIEADYLPGFYLSVLINSPRVAMPAAGQGDDHANGKLDLGKPTYRLGYLQVAVKDVYKEIDVQVSTDKEEYKPREKVKAKINAIARHKKKSEPIEIAVVAIDEAVFDLNSSGRDYYDPYKGFNRLDSLDVNNYSLLARLVGRQKFEKKGANQGGGGDADGPTLRDLFKFVAYWNPSIVVDQRGNAEIEFELPDNLTGWRLFAMAVTASDRMGLGDHNIKVNLPTELRPVMPNQLTEGDQFVAGFSVMNRTEQARQVAIDISATGPLDISAHPATVKELLNLQPYKRQTVWLPLQTQSSGIVTFSAIAKDAVDGDAIEHQVSVNKKRSLVTAANYGTTTKTQITDQLAFPEGIYPDVGGVSVVTAPSVIGNVDGAFSYIRDYPYYCWEQRLTKAVLASHYISLRAYLPKDLSWENSATLPQEMLDQAAGFQAPNGGMVYWVANNQYVSPYLSAYTALAFNWLRASGYTVPNSVEQKLHQYLDGLLRRDEMPSFFNDGMSSSVRAVALAALAEHQKISVSDISRYQQHLPEMDLFGKAHFLQAASFVEGAQATVLTTAKQILSYASQSGGKFQFSEPWDDSYSYILATPLRSNCAILSALMHVTASDDGMRLIGDIPFKQVRAVTQSRGNRDHWENTQENVFCMNALTDYAKVYESEKPDMRVKAFVGDKSIGETRFVSLQDKAVTFTDPITQVSAGLKTTMKLSKEGIGRIYYAARMQYAPTADNAQRINSGIEIRREYSVERNGKWQLLKTPMQIKRGELVRVDLYVSLPTLRHYVVVDDPVPGGLEPVNRDLATASLVDADKGDYQASDGAFWFSYRDWSYYGRYGYSFYHQELRHDAVRFYADYLPAGNYHLSYTAQAIAAGKFSVMPVHSEEMYDPDVFGKGLPAILQVSD